MGLAAMTGVRMVCVQLVLDRTELLLHLLPRLMDFVQLSTDGIVLLMQLAVRNQPAEFVDRVCRRARCR